MTTYFWNWEHGDDANDGLTPETAVLTHSRIIQLAMSRDNPKEEYDVIYEVSNQSTAQNAKKTA